MRTLLAAAAVVAALLAAAPAHAGDPIMPLGQVQSGMRCTAATVVRGTDIVGFDVEVIDVVDDRSSGTGPRILVQASGPAVDATGLGPGFSGSPIYCPDAQGVARNIGAISESVGEYGGKVVLATPIEAILGSPVDAPHAVSGRATLARARPLASPLTVTGLGTRLGAALRKAGARRGRRVLAAPAGPLGSFPVQTLRPGSAFAVSYAHGDLGMGAIGTVAYADGDRVWGFGHPLDGFGARSLLLQDAYVYRVINNPLGVSDQATTYKYAAPGHTLGTLTNDTLDGVAGRVGGPPATTPVRVEVVDLDTGAKGTVATDVADESAVDQPSGGSALSLVGPLAVLQATAGTLRGTPARVTAEGCFAIRLREARAPARFCNRYVTDSLDDTGAGSVVAGAAANDLAQAIARIDGYKASPLRVTGVDARLQVRRGQRQAFLRAVRLPHRARAGQHVRATLVLRHVRGRLERRRVTLKLPRDLPRGRQALEFTGTDVDTSEGQLLVELVELFDESGGGSLGPPDVRTLIRAIERQERYDGVRVRRPGGAADPSDRGAPAYRARDVRISGRAKATIRIVTRGR